MPSLVVGTAGHIDHGKSSLVLALTGTDPDRLKEEKARGITIDLGFAHAEVERINFAFVDVPGHERFVKNMLAGVSGIDCVLLVIAADESVMPQTREHFEICRLLQVGGGVIALTKADLVDQDTVELVRLETKDLVAGSPLENAEIVAVSARTGAGLDDLRGALARLARRAAPRRAGGVARLPIDRVFSMKGFGTVVTGTLVSGEIAAEQELAIVPAERPVKVRGVQVHGAKQTVAHAGQRTAVNLGGVDLADVTRGQTLITPGAFEPTRKFDAVLELIASAPALRHGARIRFHHGTSEVLGRVAIADVLPEVDSADTTHSADTTQTAPATRTAGIAYTAIPAGRRAYIRIRLEKPAVLTRGDRFIIRAYSPPVTIGGGEVLDPQPPRGGTRSAAARARFERLNRRSKEGALSQEEVVLTMVEERGAAGLPLSSLISRAGLAPGTARQLVERMMQAGQIMRLEPLLVPPAVLRDLEVRLLKTIAAYHETHPLAEGFPREEARERLFGKADPIVFEHVLAGLVAGGRIMARDTLALASHRVSLSGDELKARDAIERAFREGGVKPPDLPALAGTLGVAADVADRIVKLLIRQRVLQKVDTLLFHADALEQLKQDVRGLKAAASGGAPPKVDVAMFKERYGVTRKFAIPLLEYLDRERVTRRVGEARVVL